MRCRTGKAMGITARPVAGMRSIYTEPLTKSNRADRSGLRPHYP
jgi:hypothetical protein